MLFRSKNSLYWCCDGSPFKISNNVTSTTLPIAVLSFVIGIYATGILLNESGAETVIHLFSFHLSLIFRVFLTNYYRPLIPKYKLYWSQIIFLPIYFCKTFGMFTCPSLVWKFSIIATMVRSVATRVLFRV